MARAERVVAWTQIVRSNSARLVRSLRSREQKPKIFLTFLIFLGGGCGGSRQKMERKFLVLLRRFRLQNEHLYYSICGYWSCSFLRPHGETRHFLSAFGVAWNSVASILVVVTQRIWIVLRHKQICMCLTHPPVRAQIPAVFRKNYKTAGIAPLKFN